MTHLTRRTLLQATVVSAALAAAGPLAAQDGPVIASIVFQGDQFMKSLQQGIRQGAEAGGAEVLELNVNGDQARESEALDTYIARGVDAIVIAPLSASTSTPAIQRARDAGIPVVTLNGGLKDNSIPNATFTTSNVDLGRSTGEAAAAFIQGELGGEANVAILSFNGLLPEQSDQRVNGFKDAVVEGNTIDFVTQQDAWLPERGVAVATDILTANPNVNVIYAANEGGTVGAMQAVRNAGKAGQVYVFGIDGSAQLGKGLISGDNVLQATTAQSPVEMGQMGAEAALAVLDGGSVETETVVPALLLTRTDPDGVKAFLESLN